MRSGILLGLLFLVSQLINAQSFDTIHNLNEVSIHSYFEERPLLKVPASVALIDSATICQQPAQSPVAIMNTIPGVRMEERSPGSYRLSIRGSLLRSPFGIRNVKVYIDEFPFTDAGGNTYLNSLDLALFQNIEVLKGPDGSTFGANSGGVVRLGLLHTTDSSSGVFNTGTTTLQHTYERLQYIQKVGRNTFALNHSWTHSLGYRQQSAFDRKYYQFSDQWNCSPTRKIKFIGIYSDLHYQTPGGLTLQQFNNDPSAARPATKTLGGAVEQHSGIDNRTLYGGFLHEKKMGRYITQTASFFASHTDFENPFISNYETRMENTIGLRNWIDIAPPNEHFVEWKYTIGAEVQRNQAEIRNYGNRGGEKDTIQAADKLIGIQQVYFMRLAVDVGPKWRIEGSGSVDYDRYRFASLYPDEKSLQGRSFLPQIMPRLAAAYMPGRLIAYRAVISRGFSPPTFAEIRSSDNKVNTQLTAEKGWNFEVGYRLHDRNSRLWWDLSVYNYRLKQAIVRRVDSEDREYFVNAGGTDQYGLESLVMINIIRERKHGILRGLMFRNSYTYSDFKFKDYVQDTINYSGKRLTGVPQHVLVSSLQFSFTYNISFFVQHNYTSSLPLNDAGTQYADAYNLINAKLSKDFSLYKRYKMQLSFGADNVLNEKYSLGNDLNAFGGRYYNSAAPRNYGAELKLWF